MLLAACLALLAPGSVCAGPQEDYDQGYAAYRGGDVVSAIRLLKRAADAGHVEAQLQVGYIYDWSEENEDAVKYYRMAADSGDARGQFGLALLYANGEGVARDDSQAVELLQAAARQGHAQAHAALGNAYLDGKLGLGADPAKAREHLEEALERGFEEARRGLAELDRRAQEAR
jgi:hypothetical protein